MRGIHQDHLPTVDPLSAPSPHALSAPLHERDFAQVQTPQDPARPFSRRHIPVHSLVSLPISVVPPPSPTPRPPTGSTPKGERAVNKDGIVDTNRYEQHARRLPPVPPPTRIQPPKQHLLPELHASFARAPPPCSPCLLLSLFLLLPMLFTKRQMQGSLSPVSVWCTRALPDWRVPRACEQTCDSPSRYVSA